MRARCAASGWQDGGGGAAAIRFAVGTAGCAEGEAGRVARHGCDCARRHGAACRCRVAGRAHLPRRRAAAEAAADDGRRRGRPNRCRRPRIHAAAGSAAEAVEAGADPAEAACGRRASGACARCAQVTREAAPRRGGAGRRPPPRRLPRRPRACRTGARNRTDRRRGLPAQPGARLSGVRAGSGLGRARRAARACSRTAHPIPSRSARAVAAACSTRRRWP